MARATPAEKLAGYLRSFYTDDNRETGWNNLVSPNIGMPHVLNERPARKKLVETLFTARRQGDQGTDHDAEAKATAFIAL